MLSSQLSRLPLATAEIQQLRSGLLPALMKTLPRERRVAVLDLGPARQGNLDCFAPFALRYTCWDISEELAVLRALRLPGAGRLSRAEREAREAELAERRRAMIDAMLGEPPAQPWDLVLAWELFNYLERPVLSLFLQRLVQGMQKGGRIHALIWGQGHMPAKMADVRFADPHSLIRQVPAEEEFIDGGYSQYQLRGLCEGLVVHKGVLLRNGLQELNLSYRGRPE
ncbi:MAG TPA: hypothetical protein ENJ01_00240 [Gammaproteobacteria bacterium]|nr:hypothetical protein [Gammaproteobacteria bacterium]